MTIQSPLNLSSSNSSATTLANDKIDLTATTAGDSDDEADDSHVEHTLQYELKAWYNNEKLSDVVFCTDDSDSNIAAATIPTSTILLYVHAVVLAGRSHYWYKRLTEYYSQPHNASSYTVTVPSDPIHTSTIKFLCHYCYHNKLQFDLLATTSPSASPIICSLDADEPLSPTRRDNTTQYQNWARFLQHPAAPSIVPVLIQYVTQWRMAVLQKQLQVICSRYHTPDAAPALDSVADDLQSTDDQFYLSAKRLHDGEHQVAAGVLIKLPLQLDGMEYETLKIDPLIFAARSSFFHMMFIKFHGMEASMVASPRMSPASPSPPQALTQLSLIDDDKVIDLPFCTADELRLIRHFLYTDQLDTTLLSSLAATRQQPHYVPARQRSLSRRHTQLATRTHIPHVSEKLANEIATHLRLLSLCRYFGIETLHYALQQFGSKHLINAESCCTLWTICSDVDDEGLIVAKHMSNNCLRYFQHHFSQCTSPHNSSIYQAFLALPKHLLKQSLTPGLIDASFDEMIGAIYEWAKNSVRQQQPQMQTGNLEERVQAVLRELLPPSTLFNRQCKNRILGGRDPLLERLMLSMGYNMMG